MGRKITKKSIRIPLIILASLLALDLIVVGLLFIPPVQNKVVSIITAKLSEKWQSEIHIGHVYITPTLKAKVDDFAIRDHHGNDMIAADKLSTRLTGLAFSPFYLGFGDIDSEKINVVVRRYQGEEGVNIAIWAQKLKKKDKKSGFKMEAKSITLRNARFAFVDDTKRLAVNHGEIDYGFFEIKDIEWKLNHFKLNGSDISADFERMSFRQYSGFELKNLTCRFHIGPTGLNMKDAVLCTPTSRVFMDFNFEYEDWKDYGDFLNKIKFNATLRPSTFDMHEIGYFAPKAKGMDNALVVQCQVNGPVNDLHVRNIDARFGEDTHLTGNMDMKDITDFFHAEIHAKLTDNQINTGDISNFRLPNGKEIPLPGFVQKIGTATADITYDGIITERFAAEAKLALASGSITAKLQSTPHESDNGVEYVASLTSPGINIGKVAPQAKLVGSTAMNVQVRGKVGDMAHFGKTFQADVNAKFPNATIKGYRLHNVNANVSYKQKRLVAEAAIRDENCDLAVSGDIDFSQKRKDYDVHAAINHIYPNRIFAHLPAIGDNAQSGLDKFIRYVQRHSEMSLACGSAGAKLSGEELDDLAGSISIDNIEYLQDRKAVISDRIRLMLIPHPDQKVIRFKSDLLDATVSTNHPLREIPTQIIDLAYTYCGNLLPEREATATPAGEGDGLQFLDIAVSTYKVQPILSMFLPAISMANNSEASIYTNNLHNNDRIRVSVPDFAIKDKVALKGFTLDGSQKSDNVLTVAANLRRLVLGEGNTLNFEDISLSSSVGNNHLDYLLSWRNPSLISDHDSRLGGEVDFPSKGRITTRLTESEVYLKEFPLRVKEDNLIAIANGNVTIDHLLLASKESEISVNGSIGKVKDSLVVELENIGVDLVNHFIKNDKMVLDGSLSASLQIRRHDGRRFVAGSAFIKDFVFNGAGFGDLYANALVPSDRNIRFRGGLINAGHLPKDATPSSYKYKDFQNQEGKNALLSGTFDTEKKELRITADIDTLPMVFLEPMLSSFSHKFTGDASGKVAFVLNRDSMYFDGQAFVRHAEMGISALNVVYNIDGQTIDFTHDGFEFSNMDLTDAKGNHATLNGYVHHRRFQDFDLNLKVSTPKIQVLNTKRSGDTPFYGDGYISGNVSIYGNTQKLHFSGRDLSTEKGTLFCLPISFADKVSESDVITFHVPSDDDGDATDDQAQTSMEMDFDFIVDVTPAADIMLDLDLSAFGGAIKTKGDGKIHFTYNTRSDINILGDVELQKGSFMMTFANIINKKFELQPGGVVSFGGSLDEININAKAMYSTTASLSDLFTAESTNLRRMPVKTYLMFNGNLSDPAAIDFAFDLPNATNDFKNLFYSTIDTTNLQKKTEQFFSLVMLGKFASTGQTSVAYINIENTGIGILTNTLSNFISQQLKVVDVSLNYQNATADKAAQYSVGASTSLFNDRTVIEGYFGYVDDANVSNLSSQFIGDFSVEQKLNELGTWSLKVFNVTNQDELRNATRNSPYAQGVAIIYKQDFNNRKDLLASFQRKKKKERTKKQKAAVNNDTATTSETDQP